MPALIAALPVWGLLAQKTLEAFALSNPKLTAMLIALLIVLLWLSLTCIYFLSPWLRWCEKTGTWISRISNIHYCTKCKSENKTVPLKNEITGWRCKACHSWFNDPARIAKEPPQEQEKPKSIYRS